MKRLLILAAMIVAIGAGGNIARAHAQTTSAQTLTPAQTAALQQQLDVAKAQLANLQMQAGAVPPADAGTPSTVPPSIAGTGSVTVTPATPTTPVVSTGLSADQISVFKATLSALAGTLTQLAASISANTTIAPSQQVAVQTTLNGMQSTLVAMANTIATANSASAANSAPIAATTPSSPVAVNTAPAASAGGSNSATVKVSPTTANSPTVAANTAPSTNNNAPQTAQASSFWSFTKAHWPTIVIVLLVIAILAILFWPEKETVRTVSTGNSGSGKPKSAPTANVTVVSSQSTGSNPPRPMSNNGSAATPVASAVAAPAQK